MCPCIVLCTMQYYVILGSAVNHFLFGHGGGRGSWWMDIALVAHSEIKHKFRPPLGSRCLFLAARGTKLNVREWDRLSDGKVYFPPATFSSRFVTWQIGVGARTEIDSWIRWMLRSGEPEKGKPYWKLPTGAKKKLYPRMCEWGGGEGSSGGNLAWGSGGTKGERTCRGKDQLGNFGYREAPFFVWRPPLMMRPPPQRHQLLVSAHWLFL